MKSIYYLLFLSIIFFGCNSNLKREDKNSQSVIKVLQFNIWQEGTVVPHGYEGIIQQILASDADLITLSEVRNYNNTRFCDRIVKSLKDSGQIFYSFYSYDSGILSKYPIIDSTIIYPCLDDHGSVYRAIVDINGQEIALYTAHLDYLNCTYYDIRGYSGSTWEKRSPMIDIDSILANNVLSKRSDGIQSILDSAKSDKNKDRIIIIGGDFNEPSHFDWDESTKNMYDHHGLVVPWTVSKMLADNRYIDAYRKRYPDPLFYPGFTFPADCPTIEVEKLVWAPDADERERIDFIYYSQDDRLFLDDITLWGPEGSIKKGKRVVKETQEQIKIGNGIWPSDHKAVLATFILKR